MLNHVPEKKAEKLEEKVGGSVKQSNNLKYLKKRAAKEGIGGCWSSGVLCLACWLSLLSVHLPL